MHSAARMVTAQCGRGPQLKAGARMATGEVLLFLHADVTLQRDALAWISRALAEPGAVAGAFRVRTVADAGTNRLGRSSGSPTSARATRATPTAIRRASSAATCLTAGVRRQ